MIFLRSFPPLLLGCLFVLISFNLSYAVDCNNNLTDDSEDIIAHTIGFDNEVSLTFDGFGTDPVISKMLIVDVNDDNFGDLVVGLRDSFGDNPSILIFLNDGNNSFGTPTIIALAENVAGVLPGDFNGDGAVDLAVGLASSMAVYLNDGNGVFSQSGSSSLLGGTLSSVDLGDSIGVSDFNGDGFLDIVANTTHATGVRVLLALGNGQGSLGTAAILHTTEVGPTAVRLFVVDLNKDNRADIVTESAVSSSPFIVYSESPLINNGNGAFSLGTDDIIPALGRDGRFGDFSDDGFPEWISQAVSGTQLRKRFQLHILQYAGSFFGSAPEGYVDVPLSGQKKAGMISSVEDFDGDGLQDIFNLDWKLFPGNNTIRIHFNGGASSIRATTNVVVLAGNVRAFSGFINDDELPDILYQAVRTNNVRYRINLTTAPESLDVNRNGVPDECDRATPGDFTGDKRTDYTVVRATASELHWYTRDQTSGDAYLNATPFGLSAFDTPYAGDWDGDGVFEEGVVRNWFGRLDWYQNLPGGTQVVQWGLSGDRALTGYFDSDRAVDLVVIRNSGGFNYWFFKRTRGTPRTAELWGLATDTPFTADVNGDGRDDLIVARELGGGITWFARTLSGEVIGAVPWGLAGDNLLRPIDRDGDGKADYAVSRPYGAGRQTFIRKSATQQAEVLTFGLANDRALTGHFTRGPTPELAMYRTFAGSISRFYVDRVEIPRTTEALFGLESDTLILSEGSE